MARKNDLMKILSEAQSEAEMLAKLAPGTEDYRKHENKVTELKARHEAGREQAEREFTQRQAEMMATLYKEVQAMVSKVAEWRKMNYIVKISNQPVSGANPNSVMAAISSTIVYADPPNDITNDVTHNLNLFYKRPRVLPRPRGRGDPAAGIPGAARRSRVRTIEPSRSACDQSNRRFDFRPTGLANPSRLAGVALRGAEGR